MRTGSSRPWRAGAGVGATARLFQDRVTQTATGVLGLGGGSASDQSGVTPCAELISACAGEAPSRALGPGKVRASLLSWLLAANGWRFIPLIGRPSNLLGAMRRQVMAWAL